MENCKQLKETNSTFRLSTCFVILVTPVIHLHQYKKKHTKERYLNIRI